MGAKVLYFFLDDTGRGDGETPLLTQSQMSQAISASLRSVGEYLRELEERRYLIESRRSRGSVITLAWPLVGELRRSANSADHSAPDTQNLPITHAKFADHLLICKTANYYSEQTLSPEVGNETEKELVAAVESWIREYPGAGALVGVPGEAIARRCLDAVDWNLQALSELLAWLHKVKRAKPARSWGWFPAVLEANYRPAADVG